MAESDIRIATHVRQILGRHYIKPSSAHVMVGRGGVRIIGQLERTEAKAYMPIDDDYIHKLKNEIRRIKGVKTVMFSHRSESKDAERKEPEEQQKPEEHKEQQKPEDNPPAGADA